MNENDASVVVENLTKRFGAFVAVNNISFQAHRGEIFGFLGPMAPANPPPSAFCADCSGRRPGVARWPGVDVAKQPEAVRQQIGYMSQKFSLYNDLKVIENLRFFAGLYSVPRQESSRTFGVGASHGGAGRPRANPDARVGRGVEAASGAGVRGAASPTHRLSGRADFGRRSRSRADKFWELIQQMVSEGITVFVTTHYMDEAEYCNRLVLIDRGRIVAMGTPTELKTRSMKGQLLLVECEPLGPGLEALRTGAKASRMRPYSATASTPQWTMRERRARNPRRRWRARGLKVGKIEPIHPSLEDVFVTLTAAREARTGRATHEPAPHHRHHAQRGGSDLRDPAQPAGDLRHADRAALHLTATV